jgi:hypothetical protein
MHRTQGRAEHIGEPAIMPGAGGVLNMPQQQGHQLEQAIHTTSRPAYRQTPR